MDVAVSSLDGLMLAQGVKGRCDDDRIGGPIVRWDAAAAQWRLWYYCRDAAFPAEIAPQFGTGRIATAVSDDGLQWSRVDGPLPGGAVFEPSTDPRAFDSTHIGLGDIVREGDTWWMVYFGGNFEVPQDMEPSYAFAGCRMRLGIARSHDGVHWQRVRGTKSGGSILDLDDDDIYAGFPSLARLDGRWRVMYTTVDRRASYWRSRVAVSDDAEIWTAAGDLQWTHEPAADETGGIVTRQVLANVAGAEVPWLMTYTAKDARPQTAGRRSICLAGSTDGVHWQRYKSEPLLTIGAPGAWDAAGVASPCLVIAGEEARLYYYGWSNAAAAGAAAPGAAAPGQPQRGIGCALALATQMQVFRRVTAPR